MIIFKAIYFFILSVKIEVVTSISSQSVIVNTPSPMITPPYDEITTPKLIESIHKPSIILPESTIKNNIPSMAIPLIHTNPMSSDDSASSTITNSGNLNPNLDNYKSFSFRDMTNVNSDDPVVKYMTPKNTQPPQIANFLMNSNEDMFDPNKSNKGIVYVNNVYINNLLLKLLK